VCTRGKESKRTDTTSNKRGTEPSLSLVHAPGEVDGGDEPEASGGGREGEFGDIFIEIRAIFIREKNLWHDD
jgi:hypothetical protein